MINLRNQQRDFFAAFSLVEVAIAMGVVSFCIVAILSLFSVGLLGSRESAEEIRAASLASSLLARMRAAPGADLTAQGFPLGPLTNAGKSQFQIPVTAPKYIRGDGTVTASAADAVTRRGYALSCEGHDANNRVAAVSITLWWPASAPYSSAAGRYSVSTFFNTEAR